MGLFPDSYRDPLSGLAKENDRSGYWGERTSVFDWCEYNYQHSPYIAETYNTLTGFSYIMVGIFQYYYYSHLLSTNAPKKLQHMFVLINPWLAITYISMGIATVAFHATLKYEWQLYDGLSMQHMINWSYICLIQRHDINGSIQLKTKSLIVMLWTVFITVWGVFSHFLGYQSLHEWHRHFGASAFTLMVVLSFSELLKTANECKGIGKATKSKDQYANFVETYFNRSGYLFIIAAISWVVENLFCPYTNIYQLHAFVWHMFTCIGLFYGSQVMIAHRLYLHRNDLKIRNVNVIPYVLSFVTFNLRK